TPKKSQIADWQPGRPGGDVIVAVDAAMVRATAGGSERPSYHGLSGATGVAPGGVAAEAPNRRPVGHGGRRCGLGEGREVTGSINHLAADDRQRSINVGDLILGTRKIVPVGDDQIGELADLDPALFAFLIREPSDVFGPHSQRRLAVEPVAGGIEA